MTAHFVPQNSGQGTLLNEILIQKNSFPTVSVEVNVAWPSAAFQRWNIGLLNVAKWGYNLQHHYYTLQHPSTPFYRIHTKSQHNRCTQNSLYIFSKETDRQTNQKRQTKEILVRKDRQTSQNRQIDRQVKRRVEVFTNIQSAIIIQKIKILLTVITSLNALGCAV